MTQLPSTDVIHGFLAAAQTLNFRRAAAQVALTPAALGRRIQVLEDLCGMPLFQRTTRSVALTEAGRRMVPAARSALEAVAACMAAARGAAAPAPIELVLGTRHDLGLSWVFPQLPLLAARLPHVTLHLYFGSTDDLIARLRTREIDCAVTSSRFADPRLGAFPLHREELVFVAAPALLRRHPLARPEHAARHALIDVSPDLPLFRYWRDAPGGGELPFAQVVRVGSLAAIHQMVLDGRGVAVLPRYFVAASLARRRLRLVFPKVRLLDDFFRLVHYADDRRVDSYRAIAGVLSQRPLT